MEQRFEYLFGSELNQRIAQCPIAWVSMGPLERHGEHLPFGLDTLKANAQNALLAKRFGGVILPPIHIAGIHTPFNPDPAIARKMQRDITDFYIREETLRMLVEDLITGLDLIGFKIIILNSGHYPSYQGKVVKQVAQTHKPENGAIAIAFDEQDVIPRIDHAGTYETSMMLALGFETRLQNIRPEHADKLGHFSSKTPPTEASVEKGNAWLQQITEHFDKIIPPLLAHVRTN
jgi:creatinine amidohydrolase